MIAQFVYALCALTCTACFGLLLRGYRRNPSPLLFWSSFSFLALAVNNVLLFVDLAIFPGTVVDLSLPRLVTGAVSGALLLYGLIRETTRRAS